MPVLDAARGDAHPALQRALVHPDRAVRARAAIALGRCHAHAARDRLAELARDDRAPDVRRAAATALRFLGHDS
ncbi:HEAT repeat domain-containing protein [Saccharothrix sp. ST-888]|uniref:HEAT repeat domain-containing protein n=1 Tax=Saccharothrix sp. ST-888 TaxID=1427391 RepID=UPI0018CEA301